MSILTHARVLRLFNYEAATGNLIWNASESNRIKVGAVAGAIARNGRRYIGVDGERQMAHRLVWFHQKGEWPSENIAPLNGDYLDTRIENLVEQTAQETVNKGKLRSTNKSGVKGVWFDKAKQKWAVQTVHNYRTTFHGYFDTIEAAKAALEMLARDSEPLSHTEMTHRREAKRANSNQRRMWDRMLRDSSGVHGWASVFDFINDVGASPKPNFYVAPADGTLPVGPDNFVWSPPQYDNSIRDERMAANRSYRDTDPRRYRDKQLRRDFGIDGIKEYDEKFVEQNGVCAICSQQEKTIRHGKLMPLVVDHDHENGAVRGLLCNECNTGIGKLRDSPDLLRSAIAYLDRWNKVETASLPDKVVPLNGQLGFGA